MEIKLKISNLYPSVNIESLVKNIFDFNIGSALTELIKIESSDERKACLLLFKTIKKTNFELAKQYGQDKLDKETSLFQKSRSLDSEIIIFLEKEVVITKDFFENTTQFNPNYLRASFKLFKNYLDLLNIDYPDGLNFIYYKNFIRNLVKEFQDDKAFYKSLFEFFDNPIIEENKKMTKLLDYYNDLTKSFVSPLRPDVDDCKETLKDLYVEPFFQIHKNSFTSSDRKDKGDFNKLEVELSVHSFLKDYYFKNIKHPNFKNDYNLLFVLGQPGQGKTSFCSKLAYDYITDSDGVPDTPLFFVKIRELVARDFINSPFDEIKKHVKQDFDFQNDKCLLVLDGLDEAYMSGGLNDGDLTNLYDRLKKASGSNNNLKIILTSRFNYLKLNDSCIDHSSVIQLSTLNNLQIKEYAEKFKSFYPENNFISNIDKILEDNKYKHIHELLQQAVLLYFIALTDIDIEEQDSRTRIYDKIFNSLAKRSWDNNGQLDYIKHDLKNNPKRYEKLLRNYIRNIAFAIYQSPKLYITINELLELEATAVFIDKCFDDSINFPQEKIKEISKYLLISFYFQESKSNDSGDTAIEFFHNSLWEFLTAEYMWEENKRLLLDKDSDGDYKTVSKEKCFSFLDRLIGQKKLSRQIIENLTNIINNASKEEKIEIALRSKPLFEKLLVDDFLLEYNKNNNCLNHTEKSLEIFNLFWLFYHESEISDNKFTEINDDKLIPFIFNQKTYLKDLNKIIFNCHYYEISCFNTKFTDIHFYETIITSQFVLCSFNRVNFNWLSFHNGLVSKCSFKEFILEKCTISKNVFFKNNSFKNYKFEDVSICDLHWFDDFIKNNTFEPPFLTNHKVEECKLPFYFIKEKMSYKIRYIGNNNYYV